MTASCTFLTLAALAAPPAAPPAAPKPDGPGPFTLTVTGDIDAATAPTVGRLTELFYQSYPKLVERFGHPKKPAPRHVRLVMKKGLDIPAYCTGSEVTVSVDWLRDHPDDVALFTHELTHAVQAYPDGVPGWFTEGLADYARQVYGPAKQPGWSLPDRLTARHKYTDAYRVTARFLVWLEAEHPGTVDKLHRRAQDGEFTEADFKTLTGRPVEALWERCVRDTGKKP